MGDTVYPYDQALYGRFALLVVDVFNFPHCPEHRADHLVHTVTLTGFEADTGEWSIVDDNPGGILCRYAYPEDVVGAALENCPQRGVRYFERAPVDDERPAAGSVAAFAEAVERYQDNLVLFSDVGELWECRWFARERLTSVLHDAFSLYHGSRVGLLEYLDRTIGSSALAESIRGSVRIAAEIQDRLLLARVIGSVDIHWLTDACGELKKLEEGMVSQLRGLVSSRG